MIRLSFRARPWSFHLIWCSIIAAIIPLLLRGDKWIFHKIKQNGGRRLVALQTNGSTQQASTATPLTREWKDLYRSSIASFSHYFYAGAWIKHHFSLSGTQIIHLTQKRHLLPNDFHLCYDVRLLTIEALLNAPSKTLGWIGGMK